MKPLVALILLAGCRQLFGLDNPVLIDARIGDGAVDGPRDATNDAAFGPWSVPVRAFVSSVEDDDPTLTDDQLEIYFNRGDDIYVARRGSITEPWSQPVVDISLSTPDIETSPEITPDGLSMMFGSNRAPSTGYDVWFTTRPDRGSVWSTPVRLVELASNAVDAPGGPTADLRIMPIIKESAPGNFDLFLSTRAAVSAQWTTPAAITELNTTTDERGAFLADALTIYLDSERMGASDIFLSTRPNENTAWSPPQRVDDLSTTTYNDEDVWLSPNRRHLYFTSDSSGIRQIWSRSR